MQALDANNGVSPQMSERRLIGEQFAIGYPLFGATLALDRHLYYGCNIVSALE